MPRAAENDTIAAPRITVFLMRGLRLVLPRSPFTNVEIATGLRWRLGNVAWNFTQGGVYGAAVSGGKSEGVINVALSKSASPLITGGAFGPEASLVAVAICLAAGAVFLVAAVRSGRWRKASFRMVLDRADRAAHAPGLAA